MTASSQELKLEEVKSPRHDEHHLEIPQPSCVDTRERMVNQVECHRSHFHVTLAVPNEMKFLHIETGLDFVFVLGVPFQ